MPSDFDFKPRNPIIATPELRQHTRAEHDAILALMNARNLSWDEAVAAYENENKEGGKDGN